MLEIFVILTYLNGTPVYFKHKTWSEFTKHGLSLQNMVSDYKTWSQITKHGLSLQNMV